MLQCTPTQHNNKGKKEKKEYSPLRVSCIEERAAEIILFWQPSNLIVPCPDVPPFILPMSQKKIIELNSVYLASDI
jgi:hypothetical protein